MNNNNNNSILPGWNFESDSCIINQKNPIWPDEELGELLWQNGQVVFQSQTQRKQQVENNYSYFDSRKVHQKNDLSTSNLSQQDEIVSWIQYPIEDSTLEQQQQQNSNLLSQFAPCDEVESFKPIKQIEEPKFTKFVSQPSNIPAPRFHHVADDSSHQKIIDDIGDGSKKAPPKFSHFSAKFSEKVVNANNNMSQHEAKECSVMTIGSSHCGSNHIPQEQDVSKVSSSGAWDTNFSVDHEGVRNCVKGTVPWSGKGKSSSEMIEPTLTSSSGGSGSSSLGKTCSLSTGNHGLKRKVSDVDELEEQSEATEPNSAVGNKASQRSGSSKRNRSAEVHNLSERRRRDRINEKMRALQELIPNSNKTDKASVLEEAVEYMKSLQLQLQIMWMRTGMGPVMFPAAGIQNYMSQMCMGMAAAAAAAPSLPSIHQHPMQLPRMPPTTTLDQSISVAQAQNKALMCQNPLLGAFNYQNQMQQNPCISDQYARYMMAYHNLMQTASQQPMNVFGYGSHVTQPSQTMNGAPNFDDAISGKMGSSTF